MSIKILMGDCRDVLKTLADESVHCAVTSPPYWGLRDYGVAGQIGIEASYQDFVAEMVAVFREVRRVLRTDGTLWLNLGDCYNAYNGGAGPSSSLSRGSQTTERPRLETGYGLRAKALKPKDLCGIPWRVAFALQDDGWWLRQDIIWSKPNPMPESVTDRCTKAHEYIFMLTKSERYYFDAKAIAEPAVGVTEHDLTGPGCDVPGQTLQRGSRKRRVPPRHAQYASSDQSGLDGVGRGAGRNKRSVWTVATSPFSEAHFATFPPALIEPCILAGCPKGGVVLDPFGGAGTTAMVADRHGRDAILVELNPTYASMAAKRIKCDGGMFAQIAAE